MHKMKGPQNWGALGPHPLAVAGVDDPINTLLSHMLPYAAEFGRSGQTVQTLLTLLKNCTHRVAPFKFIPGHPNRHGSIRLL